MEIRFQFSNGQPHRRLEWLKATEGFLCSPPAPCLVFSVADGNQYLVFLLVSKCRHQTLLAASPTEGQGEWSLAALAAGVKHAPVLPPAHPVPAARGQGERCFRIIQYQDAQNSQHHGEKLGKSLLKALYGVRIPKIVNSPDPCIFKLLSH